MLTIVNRRLPFSVCLCLIRHLHLLQNNEVRAIADITKLCEVGQLGKALKVAEYMKQQKIPLCKDDAHALLQACEKSRNMDSAWRVWSLILHSGIDSLSVLGDHLIRLLTYYTNLVQANQVFNHITKITAYSLSAIILANAKISQAEIALELYLRMLDVPADKHVYAAVLKTCTMTLNLVEGRLVHNQIVKRGFQTDVVVGSTLVDMYAKCGSLEEAQQVFENLPYRNVVSWSAMIYGYTQHGEGLLALKCLEEMQHTYITPDSIAFLSALKACAGLGAIHQGRLIHHQYVRSGQHLDTNTGNTLVNMYAKCGSIEEAYQVFEELAAQDVITWGAIIAGYAHNGEGHLALGCFEKMQLNGVNPDGPVFTSILAVCCRAGLVDEGRWHFKSMKENYGFSPSICHYNCMVELLGRAGCLYEAENLLLGVTETNAVGWTSFLSACQTYGKLELGRSLLDQVIYLKAMGKVA